jgi:hypothetical protein
VNNEHKKGQPQEEKVTAKDEMALSHQNIES